MMMKGEKDAMGEAFSRDRSEMARTTGANRSGEVLLSPMESLGTTSTRFRSSVVH